ncbi:hypothetical protein GCM10022415_09550 [Knoellia locipacati]|uniref:DUF4333 domain-containing protein n=1 Tax=Knoellia locipacati TaxID=882824 RepID=A0A512SYA1_9MICO|nr:hypothetical protein [Knoellia locipacati]GEQ12906.1 hypothetical protein KLO01_09530 [Knoellia locipacati]
MGTATRVTRWTAAAGVAAAAAAAMGVAGCGAPPTPARPEPGPRPTVAPTVRATTSPGPAPTGVPRDPRGIPALHQAGSYAIQVQEAVQREIDRRDPGRVHVVSCLPVPMVHLPGASTRCDIVTDGLPSTWTSLTVPGTAPDGGLVVEISEGIRSDLPPFPPPG